jgi:hypothetical protein
MRAPYHPVEDPAAELPLYTSDMLQIRLSLTLNKYISEIHSVLLLLTQITLD